MKIEKLPSGSYRIRKMYRGIRYTITVDHKPTQKEVVQLLAAEMDKVQVKKERMTFESAAIKYLEIKENVLSPSTARSYRSITRNLSEDFKKSFINDITSVEIQKEINGHPNSITRYLHKAQASLGIPEFGLHKLRHYYASVSHSLGMPDSYIMKSGGWKSDATLKTVYRHAMIDKETELQKFTGDYLGEIIFNN